MKEEIAVLMSVYNAENYLRLSIDSVLNQSYPNFLFYIIDDCSTDNSLNIIKSYSDKRIRLIENEFNIGLTKSLNRAIEKINTKYIARMDADDICISSRLKKQFEFLEKNIDIAMVGTSADVINDLNENVNEFLYEDIDLKERLFFNNCFVHSSIMIKTKVLKDLKYDENFKYAQDYNLWVKVSRYYAISNIKEKLLKYRVHNKNISYWNRNEQYKCVLLTIRNQLLSLGIKREEQLNLYSKLHLKVFIKRNVNLTFKERLNFISYLIKILKLNRKVQIYNSYFDNEIKKRLKEEKLLALDKFKNFLLKKYNSIIITKIT